MKIHTSRTQSQVINTDHIHRRIFYIVLAVFLLVGGLYVYFLTNTIFNVIERKTVEREVKSSTEEVNALQIQYLALNNNINLSLAESLGFKEAKSALFASRTDLARSVSLR